MAGLIKQKQYDWKDTNLALFGSDTERQVKKESAQTEPAWNKAGEKVGVQIWRIVKFKVTHWPKEEYGKFYDGDSYIILNTFKEDGGEELLFDVHFWIGKYSTADEYGTAAYKTVELDTLLDDKPIQHREVQGHESDLFKSYFNSITYLRGGADSGFRNVKPEEYKPRLLHFCGDRHKVVVTQIPRGKKLDSGDVYILDLGKMIYQWNGKGANKDEKLKAAQYLVELKGVRCGKAKSEVLEEEDVKEGDEFSSKLGIDKEEEEEDFSQSTIQQSQREEKKLFRVSDASGKMNMKLEKSGRVDRGDFDTNDVFIYDTSDNLFVWIGKQSTNDEKKNAMTYAHHYLMKSNHPLIPVTCLSEGKNNRAFDTALAA
ncbi:gelsolin-like protein 2 isoform X2 [Pecten maximus]|uniref:gelsolin-like protein 2 isoform X2 n=1 Tax=Pecten maximus TaxID=6579 RepID=UPI00145917AF|nr:gelsolin-like protein 2 isoform X2 [Pecten maximus]XP_033746062.1 gelsolin-like protein 2 isoform X2 [Pecten maximus]XP_033746063.1 gelsolin-like protein 2 isoform X2 [Pecten maximus]